MYMIWEALKESLVILNMEAVSCRDVFSRLGGALIREGYVKDTYIDALCAREKEYPTGLDIDGFGVAIPHTDASQVYRAATAIAVLKNPVPFIQMGTDNEEIRVKIVFLLAVANPGEQMEELQRILTIIQDTDILTNITQAGDVQNVIDIIKEKERSL